MNETWDRANWTRTLEQIFRRAMGNAEFRQLCLTQPDAAIKEISGLEVPPEYAGKVRFAEEKGEGNVIVLPKPGHPPNWDNLTDAELEQVAGGNCCWNTNPLCWDTKPI